MGNAARQMRRRRAKEGTLNIRPKRSKEEKRRILIIACAVILVVILLLAFWSPTGAVKSWFGKLMFISENDLVVKIDNRYYSIGTFTLPDGFTEDTSYTVSSDANRYEIKADTDDPSSPLRYFYLTPVASAKVDTIQATFLGRYDTTTDIQTLASNGHSAQWFSVSYQSDDDNNASFVRNICLYLDAARDCKILISLYSQLSVESDIPSDEELLVYLDTITAGLSLK